MKLSRFVPQFVKSAFNIAISKPTKTVVITRSRKRSDTTKLTELQREFVKFNHEQYKRGNRPAFATKKDLVIYLNTELGLDKGITAYAKIWSPKKSTNIPLEG